MSIVSLALPSTEALSFGSSKLFQILVPLVAYMILQETPGLKTAFPRALRAISPQADVGRWEYIFKMLVGFVAWKIGCDFGFLIVTTNGAPWALSFTFSGLVPYALGMYAVYHLLGTKMLVQGQLNPFKEEYRPPRIDGRPSWGKQFFAKFFHESMNATSANVPLRQVSLKPLIDYGAILVTWPLYKTSMMFFQSGEINFSPFIRFTFLPILVFYIVNVIGFILGFNFGEFLYFRAHYLIEFLKKSTDRLFEAKRIGDLWRAFDLDSDGAVSISELRQVMRSLGQDVTEAEIEDVLGRVDRDRSGYLDFAEFREFLQTGRGERRVQLTLQTLAPATWFERALGPLAIRWQAIKNNTRYIRLQGFLRRYGLNNRWLLSGSMGLLFIVLLEPGISQAIFSWSDWLQHEYYYHFGSLDLHHLQQVADASPPRELPLPALATGDYSQSWSLARQ